MNMSQTAWMAVLVVAMSQRLVAQTAAPVAPPQGLPCAAPAHHQLDFWVGEWRVFQTADNVEVATSRIEIVMSGCGIKETVDSPGAPGGHYIGTSYSSYDRKDGKWHQMYIDTTGSVGLYTGGTDGADMAFNAPGRGSALLRMVYKPLADGSVRQIGTVSNDQGKTWQPEYDYTYRR